MPPGWSGSCTPSTPSWPAVLAVWWLVGAPDADPLDGSVQQAAAYVAGARRHRAVRAYAASLRGLVFGVLAVCFAIALLIGAASTGVGVAFAAYTVLVR